MCVGRHLGGCTWLKGTVMSNEPGAAVLSIFDQLIDRIKQRSPLRSDGKPLDSLIYSQLALGMPVWKDDYNRPWSPTGGASLRSSFQDPAAPAAPGGKTPLSSGAAPGGLDSEFLLAMQAAWKTALLCRTLLQVTKDGAYREYPAGRHLDFAYESVINGMQPGKPAQMSADVRGRLNDAQRVLYVENADGNISNTPLYERYLNNAQALATAKSNFAAGFALAQRDPAKFEVFPVRSAALQLAVDTARTNLVGQGALKVEAALDVIASVGRSMQANMINKAKQRFADWNLGISGAVPASMPYSLILPSNWCDAEDHQGWEKLVVDQAEIRHWSSSGAVSASASAWQSHAQSSGAEGGVLLGFSAFGASHGSPAQQTSFQDTQSCSFQSPFGNTAKGLQIELEFGLCKIERPWLVNDVFYVKDWYGIGTKKNSISDGTVNGQADSQDKLLPMIPQQFLVVRNVNITASEWGNDGELLERHYGSGPRSSRPSQSDSAGPKGVCLGFINFGGKAADSESEPMGQASSFNSRSSGAHFGATWNNRTLTLAGAQIVAFMSSIVPACPGMDDPALSQ
jgi:hypothetical protein